MSDETTPVEASGTITHPAEAQLIALKGKFLEDGKKDLAKRKAQMEEMVRMMEEDVAKIEAMTPEEFSKVFLGKIVGNVSVLQDLVGRFEPPTQPQPNPVPVMQ